MKKYCVRKLANSHYGYVILAASYQSPLESREELESELSRKGYSGTVVFDMLLATGNQSARFTEMYFDGQSFQLCSAKTIKHTIDEVVKITTSFYHSHFEQLDTSILSKPIRFKLRKGVAV